MTITEKEAARILDPETSRDALWEYEEEDRLEACNEACRVAAAVLRAQPPKLGRKRWEGCRLCRGATALSGSAFIHKGNNPVSSGGFTFGTMGFCPVCGKPQTEAAWAELERRIGGPDETE